MHTVYTCRCEVTFISGGFAYCLVTVYPALSPDAQKEWLDIEEGFYRQELTLQGYNKRRKKLFVNAGFLPHDGTEKQKETVRKPKGEVEKRIYPTENSSSVATDGFRSVEQCSEVCCLGSVLTSLYA